MNCLEARRRLLIDPGRLDPETRAHLSACATCAHEADRLLRLDEAIRDALQIDPTSGLESRIRLAQVLRCRPARVRSCVMASTAAILISLGVAIWTLWAPRVGEPLSEDALAVAVLKHIQAAPKHLQSDDRVPPRALASMLAQFGARLQDDLGTVHYLGRCRIGRTYGVHLVLEGVVAPITVLLMPGEQALRAGAVRDARFHGMVVPAGRGSMAVVGEKAEPLEKVVEKLGRAVVWES